MKGYFYIFIKKDVYSHMLFIFYYKILDKQIIRF